MRSFWTVWKSTRHLSSIVELSLSILHTLFSLNSENASTLRACPPTKHEKSISGSRHGMQSSHQGCWAPVLLSLEVRPHLELGVQLGPLTLECWPSCLTMDAGVNHQCSGSYFFYRLPHWALSVSGFWLDSVHRKCGWDRRRKEKLGQALSPCFCGFGQWLPHSIAGFVCLSSTGIWSWVSPYGGGLSCALLDISHWPLFPRWQ